MGTEKRARQKAGHQERQARLREAERKAAAHERNVRLATYGAIALVIVVVIGIAIKSGSSDTTVSTGASTTIPDSLPSTIPPVPGSTPGSTPPGTNPDGSPITTVPTTAPATPVAPPPGSSIPPGTPTACPAADGSAPRVTTFAQAPPTCIDPAKKYSATITTDKGEIVMDLDAAKAPKTVNNFVVLARYHYYDGVPFHRVLRGFMAQTGDAVGPTLGTGGPGYKFDDELPTGDNPYKAGDVAMANSGPNTNGSQFFIYTGPNPLGPQYSLFGHVTTGLDTTVKAIMDGGSDTDGAPLTNASKMISVTITES